jgi:hypothetical protein
MLYIIFDIEKGYEDDALKDLNIRTTKILQSVKGITGSLEPLMGIEEVFSLLSMAAPAV